MLAPALRDMASTLDDLSGSTAGGDSLSRHFARFPEMTDGEKVRVLGAEAAPPSRTPTSPSGWGFVVAVITLAVLIGFLAVPQRAVEQAPTAVAPSLVIVEHNPDPAVIGPAAIPDPRRESAHGTDATPGL